MTSGKIDERVFSTKCPKCRQRTIELADIPYQIQIDHDGRKYPVDIAALSVPKCTNCGTLSINVKAAKVIDDEFRREARLLPPEQIRGNREQLGLTQKTLAARLRIGEATLLRWKTGPQVQQRSLDRLLRVFFSFKDVREALADENPMGMMGVTVSERM